MQAMLRSPAVSLPLSEPLALIDATLLFLVQVLLARHPDLLYAPPESGTDSRPPPRTRAVHHILDAVREVHNALEIYNAAGPDTDSRAGAADDEIPF
jgi:hypothetical protein